MDTYVDVAGVEIGTMVVVRVGVEPAAGHKSALVTRSPVKPRATTSEQELNLAQEWRSLTKSHSPLPQKPKVPTHQLQSEPQEATLVKKGKEN